MKELTQIGGIKIKNVHHETLKEKILFPAIVKEPLAHIIQKEVNDFEVNIIAYIPNNIKKLNPLESAVKVSEKVYLKYNGLLNLPTWISSSKDGGFVFCRDFEIVYDSEKEVELFDIHRISFEYSLENPDFNVQAEAIYIRDENIDPKTSRGTIITVRSDQR